MVSRCFACWLALSATTHAQALRDNTEDSLPLTNDPTDPIGIERDSLELPSSTRSAAVSGKADRPGMRGDKLGPEPPVLNVQSGEVVTGAASVRERAHQVTVELTAGYALVHSELEFENAGEKPAEIAYRLAVPSDAALFGLEVCNLRGCRTGSPDSGQGRIDAYDEAVLSRAAARSAGLPVGDARPREDARGSALWLRAAPVTRDKPLRIRVDYIAQTTLHAGVARLSLPARGMDPRAAPARVQSREPLRVNELPLQAGESRELDAWSPIAIESRVASAGVHIDAWKSSCGKLTCLRAYATARAETPPALDIVLAIDASPSTEGGARSRLLSAVSAVLAQAPAGSRVRALRFASQATPLLAEPKLARDLALAPFAPIAFEAELGAATRFEAAWQLIERFGLPANQGPKLVIIIGDGGLTTGNGRAFESAKRKRVEVAVLNVGDRPTDPALVRSARSTGGAVIEAGSEADSAARNGSLELLEERAAALFQPARGLLRVNGAALELRAGDSVSWEGTGSPRLEWAGRALNPGPGPSKLQDAWTAHVARGRAAGPRWIAVDRADLTRRPAVHAALETPGPRSSCDRRGPAERVSGVSSDAAPVQLAEERALCALPPAPPPPAPDTAALGAGMPGSPLLSMLRQRILPAARGCFRRDRAGRADYQVRAVFEFELADREVLSAQVKGQIAEPLRECLLAAIDALAVPRFTGRVVVRYPLVTERETLPSQIELTADTAERIDRVLTVP